MTRTTLVSLASIAALPLLCFAAVKGLDAQEVSVEETARTDTPDRAATEAIVRDFLLENPEVIIEALERWRETQAIAAAMESEEVARDNLDMLSQGLAGYAMGADADEAEVVVVEFFDYHCGYCRRAADFVFALAEEDGIRVVLQDLPILREESRDAALAGLAAAKLGAYPAMHRELMRASGVLDETAIAKAAKRAGVPAAATSSGRTLDDLRDQVKVSVDIARAMGLDGTPSFVVASADGRFVRVIPSYAPEDVEAAIADARAL